MRVTTHFLLWMVGLAKPETQTTEAERACLVSHASGKKRLVEIGVWHGVTTRLLRQAMAADAVLFAVDPYPNGRFGFSPQKVIAQRQLKTVDNGILRWLRKTGAEAGHHFAQRQSEPVDFVFIDGDHSFTGLREDWEAWSGLVSAGGVVALHDSCSSEARNIDDAGSVKYTDSVIRNDARFHFVEAVDTLSIFRRV